mgnify:CR=1 FL=1
MYIATMMIDSRAARIAVAAKRPRAVAGNGGEKKMKIQKQKYIVRHYAPGGGETSVRHTSARAAIKQIKIWRQTGATTGSIVAYGPRKNRKTGDYEIARDDA